MFRFTKAAVFYLADLLEPAIRKKDTHYRLAIPVVVRVACTLFKLCHGASLLVCREIFAVGRSFVSMVLQEVVSTINEKLRSEISWPRGETLARTANEFQQLCGLPRVVGAIDYTHVSISKPRFGPIDYFYFKSGGYTINCQAVVDSNKRFLDFFLGMPGSTNDSRVLRRSTLYYKAVENTLWDARFVHEGFSPYLLANLGYPLLPRLMVPHRGGQALPIAGVLFNKKMRRGRGVVKNAFAQLKQTFRELLMKTELHVTFVPDVIVACGILHSILLKQGNNDIGRLLDVLREEGLQDSEESEDVEDGNAATNDHDQTVQELGEQKRQQLGLYLAELRQVPH